MTSEVPIGLRMAYRDLLLSGQLKTIFRPYNLKYETLYRCGATVDMRVIARPGISAMGIDPVFGQAVARVKVIGFRQTKIKDLTPEDFANSSPDVQDAESLGYHLALIYDKPVKEFSPDSHIVKIDLEYVEQEAEMEKAA